MEHKLEVRDQFKISFIHGPLRLLINFLLSTTKVVYIPNDHVGGCNQKGENWCLLICISLISNAVGLLKKRRKYAFIYLYFFCEVTIPVLCLIVFGMFGGLFLLIYKCSLYMITNSIIHITSLCPNYFFCFLLTIFPELYTTSLWLACFITGSLYILFPFIFFT